MALYLQRERSGLGLQRGEERPVGGAAILDVERARVETRADKLERVQRWHAQLGQLVVARLHLSREVIKFLTL